MEENAQHIESVCQENRARQVRRAKSAEERDLLWKGRKNAFGALGRISPSYYVQDGVIPRTRLPEMLEFIEQTATKYGVKIGNIFHAGDGNLHPIILFDPRDENESRRVREAAAEILAQCIDMGGSITGEHGVGIEKINLMPYLFSADDLDMMRKIKEVFNPEGASIPERCFPRARCAANFEPRRVWEACCDGGRGFRTHGARRNRWATRRWFQNLQPARRWRWEARFPSMCVEPPTAESVAAVLKFAADHDLAVIPRGNGTKLALGNPPRRYDLALSLRELNRRPAL